MSKRKAPQDSVPTVVYVRREQAEALLELKAECAEAERVAQEANARLTVALAIALAGVVPEYSQVNAVRVDGERGVIEL